MLDRLYSEYKHWIKGHEKELLYKSYAGPVAARDL